jgi:ketosteroid isomerase-like protein
MNRTTARQPPVRYKQPFKTRIVFALCFVLLSLCVACQQQQAKQQAPTTPDTREADVAALKAWDANWSKAAGAKDVDKTVSYYADDVIVQPPNGKIATSKADIRKIWADMLSAPGFGGGWQATKIEVARSGELAYLSGSYEFTFKDASGKPTTDRGKFVEIVKKQPDGSWKCVNDIWNSDLPLPAPTAK